ncbi:DNA cytosine methyltransferase [Marinobacter excellens]|jgi:DNA (cytosine-5)-methyltransferase 1|uniref:DNA (cytosine-5-)-methyltransferase n=1 Tax=Marinobacter excellens LAMA 842 TaxID=1306954 RepID=A0A137S8P2_9GAMM|nr:DNA cytosine methyltransferase [Marinobacter excellens]KXO08801.1 Site-specific DNA methylase [Marinobacter excellens LAMA 842]
MLKFVDLFCGGGLGARGAVSAGATPILAVDAWDQATKTYKSNFPSAEVICSPIEDLSPSDLAKHHNPDVLLTSPECTSHSIARGAKPSCERSRETAIGIVPWLEAMQPRWLIVENVNRMRKWGRHSELVNDIRSKGYEVNDLYLNAADFGAPQARKRMFLVCDRNGSKISEEDLKVLYAGKIKSARSIVDKTGKYQSRPLYTEKRATATLLRAERAIAELGRGKNFIIVYYGSDYAGGWQSLDVPLRTVTTLDRFGLVTWQNDIPYLRMLQPDELLRAMGAGSEHQLPHGSRRDKVKLCGNGVCSPVMKAIFNKLIEIENNGQ